jgi:O-Antigen ligase
VSLSILLICVAPFAVSFYLGRRSLALGLAATLAAGYAFGIVRANLLGASFFLFDSSAAGLYLAAWMRRYDVAERIRLTSIWRWVLALTIWPLILFCLPMQDPMVQLVGLRSAVFFLPMVLIGAVLNDEDMYVVALCVAALNLAVFGFAVAEYLHGIKAFYPINPVTQIIYNEHDLAHFTAWRIPGTFATPAAYGSAMVMSLPLIMGAWLMSERSPWRYRLLSAAIAASILGVFMSASRSQALILFVLGAVFMLSGVLTERRWLAWLVIVAGIVWLVGTSNRLQRFTLLEDTDMVGQRVSISVNTSFLDFASEYPLGNGLGGGGTSIPYFLQDRLRGAVGMENEYARIMLEEGLPGLVLWIAFILWALSRKGPRRGEPWYLSRRLAWYTCAAYFGTAFIGLGLLTAVPNAAMLLMYAGWVAAPPHPLPSRAGAAAQDPQQVAWRFARRRYGW